MLFRAGEILGIKLKVGDVLKTGKGFDDSRLENTICTIVEIEEHFNEVQLFYFDIDKRKHCKDYSTNVRLSGGLWYNFVWWE